MDTGIGNRESGIAKAGNRESGIGNCKSKAALAPNDSRFPIPDSWL